MPEQKIKNKILRRVSLPLFFCLIFLFPGINSAQEKISLEAETAALVSPFAIGVDPAASLGRYISLSGLTIKPPAPLPQQQAKLEVFSFLLPEALAAPLTNDSKYKIGKATLSFSVTQPDAFFLWLRVLAPSGSKSLTFQIDSNPLQNLNIPTTPSWQWLRIETPAFNLSSGQHSLTFQQKDLAPKDSTSIDKAILINDPNYTPTPQDVTLDTTPPQGSIKINNDTAYTNSQFVTLTLSAQDSESGMGSGAQIKLSNDNANWTSAIPYSPTLKWKLLSGDGEKTVYVRFKDVVGNWSSAYSDKIILDTTLPLIVIISPQNDAIFSHPNINVEYTVDGLPKSNEVTLVEGANPIIISEQDPAGNVATAQIVAHYNPGTLVEPNLGATIYSPDGQASVEIPPGALSVPTTISVTNLNPRNYTGMAPANYTPQGIVTFRPEGQVFNLPVTIKMPLDNARVPGTEVALGILDTGSGLFELLASGNMFVASDGISASTKINHFSTYGAFENIISSGAAIGSAEIPLPDLFTGAFSHRIKIETPPGRKGIEPNIALLYRSNLRNSWLGYGWDLNPGYIERDTKAGIPAYKDTPSEPLDLGDGSDGELILTSGTTVIDGTKNYTKVDIGTDATVTSSAWDGSSGGELIIKCLGDVKIRGRVDVSGKGHRGGAGGGWRSSGTQGESYNGPGGQSMVNNYGGGGAGHGSVADVAQGQQGAGGGYGTSAPDVPTYWGMVQGGELYGDSEISILYKGSGGGGGGDDGAGRSGGTGGNGGGAIKIIAKNIVVSDTATVSANGVSGTAGGNGVGGGGGSGGSILLMAEQANIIGQIAAKGGIGVNNGGNGGEGRIRIVETERVDSFVYSSGGARTDLVNLIDNLYQSKIESGFVKFYKESNDSWKAVQKDGTTLYFGITSNSKVTNSKGTFKWFLGKIQDTNGNYMELIYIQDSGQAYLSRIAYTGNSTTGFVPMHTIDFILEDRTDTITSFVGGSSIITRKRLKEIDIKASGALARKYVLNYTYSPDTKKSLLSYIDQYGSDGVTKFPTMTFKYRGKQ